MCLEKHISSNVHKIIHQLLLLTPMRPPCADVDTCTLCASNQPTNTPAKIMNEFRFVYSHGQGRLWLKLPSTSASYRPPELR